MSRKYRIKDLLNQMSQGDYKKARRVLPKYLGVSKSTLDRWIYAPWSDTIDIPGEKLVMIASFFGVEPEDLFTERPEGLHFSDVISKGIKEEKDKLNLT